MVATGFLLASLMAAGAAAGDAIPTKTRQADREAIRAHIDRVFRAYMARDRATVEATHAREWRGFLTRSRGIIRGLDEYMREADAILAGPVRITAYRMRDFDVYFLGDLAIVPYIADLSLDVNGSPRQTTLRVLDLYAKEHAEWNQMASQVAAHPDVVTFAGEAPPLRELGAEERRQLLAEREAVWRAYFAADEAALKEVLPPELIGINAGEEAWVDAPATITAAKGFVNSGGKLVSLSFPETRMQVYGDVAILYTTWAYELENAGQRERYSGRATEIFVRRNGHWVNSGWHLDSGK
ncbi:MAG TPA: nuclear transport factor 2 family protein [Terriglobales bacterium]|nr:nuclear transport factor 2 family protein [Terriglobales bacterium]